MIEQIKDNLWQVGGRGLTNASDAACYLIRFGDKAALVDAGTGRESDRLSRNIAKCLGPDAKLEYLLLTHCHYDHAGGAPAVRNEFGCRIVAHELDAVYMESGDNSVTGAKRLGAEFEPFNIDIKLKDKETKISVGDGEMSAIHCPGHSPGSVVYTARMDDQLVLFGSDAYGPLQSEYLSDEKQYLDSMAMLLELDADILLEGHFGVIEPKKEVRIFIGNCITPAPEPCRC